jgi:hypothetical protein
MATTNFLPFDGQYQNVEQDSQYLADSSRVGGFAVDAIVPSPLLNKVLLQTTTMAAALATSLANKGISTSDANFDALVTALSNIRTTADSRTPLVTMLFSPTAVFNATTAAAFEMILTGNLTNPAFTVMPGTTVTFAWQQDSVGGRTITYGGTFFGAGPAQPDPTPGAISMQSFLALNDGILRPVSPMTVSPD